MKPYYENAGVTIYHGNCLAVLRSLPSESVNCCVTSPPYWGLRAYGTDPQVWGGTTGCEHEWGDAIRTPWANDVSGPNGRVKNLDAAKKLKWTGPFCEICGAWRGELGAEPTYQIYVDHMVSVFKEVNRILRPDGTLWLNLGDCYATGAGLVGKCPGGGEQGARWAGTGYRGAHDDSPKHSPGAIGPVTQANRMPQAGLKPKDLVGIPWRVAFALQEAGWYLRSDIIWSKPNPMPESVTDRCTKAHEYLFHLAKSETYYCDMGAIAEDVVSDHGSGNGFKRPARLSFTDENGARGNEKPWVPNGKHAGTSPQASGRRMVENVARARASGAEHDSPFGGTRNKRSVWTVNTQSFPEAHFATFPPDLILPCILAGCSAGGTVIDPFFGAGTTGLVAKENGRLCIGAELNEDYIHISMRRLSQEVLAF